MSIDVPLLDEEKADFYLQIIDFLNKMEGDPLLPSLVARIRIETQLDVINGKLDLDSDKRILFATVPNKEFPSPWRKVHYVNEDTYSIVLDEPNGSVEVGSGLSEFLAQFLVTRANHQNWSAPK